MSGQLSTREARLYLLLLLVQFLIVLVVGWYFFEALIAINGLLATFLILFSGGIGA